MDPDLDRSPGDGPLADDPSSAELARRFWDFADTASTRAPLYARLASGVADDPTTGALLLHAPPTQRLPVLLFACVHWLLINEPDHALRRFYPNLVGPGAGDGDALDRSDPYPAFAEFCRREEPRLAELLASRVTQTNEVGRCATLLPALAVVQRETDEPLAVLDVGTSAGLTLGLDRYEYVYEPGGRVGPPSPVTLTCGVSGPVPIPSAFPTISRRRGLDRSPVDLRDPDAATWLEACVWPDQTDRFHRLRHAIECCRQDPIDVRRGDAVHDLAASVADLRLDGHPVVTTTWVLNYLGETTRQRFLDALGACGAGRDLTWVFAESPRQSPGIPVDPRPGEEDLTHLGMVRWRDGERTASTLATAHPHGYWLHWR